MLLLQRVLGAECSLQTLSLGWDGMGQAAERLRGGMALQSLARARLRCVTGDAAVTLANAPRQG